MSALRVRTVLSGVDRSLLLPQRIGPQFLYVTHEPGYRLDKAWGLSGRYPFHSEPVRVDPAVCEHYLDRHISRVCLLITFQVMAFTEVSTNSEDPVGPPGNSVDDDFRVDHSGAHHPDYAQIRWILQSTDPSQVSSGESSPGAQKSYDDRLIIIRHRGTPF